MLRKNLDYSYQMKWISLKNYQDTVKSLENGHIRRRKKHHFIKVFALQGSLLQDYGQVIDKLEHKMCPLYRECSLYHVSVSKRFYCMCFPQSNVIICFFLYFLKNKPKKTQSPDFSLKCILALKYLSQPYTPELSRSMCVQRRRALIFYLLRLLGVIELDFNAY